MITTKRQRHSRKNPDPPPSPALGTGLTDLEGAKRPERSVRPVPSRRMPTKSWRTIGHAAEIRERPRRPLFGPQYWLNFPMDPSLFKRRSVYESSLTVRLWRRSAPARVSGSRPATKGSSRNNRSSSAGPLLPAAARAAVPEKVRLEWSFRDEPSVYTRTMMKIAFGRLRIFDLLRA